MSSSNISSTVGYLDFLRLELNIYIPIILLVLGTIAHVLNALVFTRSFIRTNPCAIYLISASVTNFISIYIGLVTPFLGSFDLDPTQSIDILCKMRLYLRYSAITLSTWFILLACMDRYFSTCGNVNIRLWSSQNIVVRNIAVVTIIGFIVPYTQVFYCYKINQNRSCSTRNPICMLINDIILLLCNSGLPPVFMVLLSILTIRNIQYFDRLIQQPNHAQGNRGCRSRPRRDLQLIRLLFIQVLFCAMFSIPIVIQKLYKCSTVFNYKDTLTTAIDSLINQISTELSYISNCLVIYIYILTNKKYRKEVSNVVKSLLKCCRHNQIHPIND